MPTCSCPVGTVIPTITPSTCPYDIGQIQKLIFQRQGQIAATGVTSGALEATWTALAAATGDTKIDVTPYVYNAMLAAGDPIIEGGGDNTTLNGIGIVNETNPTTFTGYFRQQQQSVIAAIRDYQCESIQVYFVNDQGKLIHSLDSSDQVVGFPLYALFVGDLRNEGYGVADKNDIQFQLKAEWGDSLTITAGSGSFSFLSL